MVVVHLMWRESRRYAAQKARAQTDKNLKDTLLKLSKCDKARKSVEVSIESSERQAQEQLRHLREVKGQLALARARVVELPKEPE